MVSDVEKVCMKPLGNGVLCLSHILFVACFTSDQADQGHAFTIDLDLQHRDWPEVMQVNSSLVLRIRHNLDLMLVHILWTLVEKLLKKVDFLGVSLLHSGRSVSEVLEVVNPTSRKLESHTKEYSFVPHSHQKQNAPSLMKPPRQCCI